VAKIDNFKDLKVWQKGMEIVSGVYRLTEKFPKKETFGLVSQMRRCGISIPSNVAEGFKRQHSKEFRQFLHIALGSGAELETQLLIAKDLGYNDDGIIDELVEGIDHFSRMTRTLIRKLK